MLAISIDNSKHKIGFWFRVLSGNQKIWIPMYYLTGDVDLDMFTVFRFAINNL